MMESNSFTFLTLLPNTAVTQGHWVRIILGSPSCLFGRLIMSWTQLRDVCSSLCVLICQKKKNVNIYFWSHSKYFEKDIEMQTVKMRFFFSGDESRFCYCLDESKDEVYGDIGN